MSQLCTEEIKPIVEKLVSKLNVNLGHIDPTKILYVTGKGKRRPLSFKSVPAPYNLCTPFRFVLTINPKFNDLSDNKKAIAIFDELLRVQSFDEGKLKAHSVVGNYETIATFGVDWLEKEEEVASIYESVEPNITVSEGVI